MTGSRSRGATCRVRVWSSPAPSGTAAGGWCWGGLPPGCVYQSPSADLIWRGKLLWGGRTLKECRQGDCRHYRGWSQTWQVCPGMAWSPLGCSRRRRLFLKKLKMYFGKENNTWNGVLLTNIICEDDHNIGFVATETLLEEDREHQSQAWPRHVRCCQTSDGPLAGHGPGLLRATVFKRLTPRQYNGKHLHPGQFLNIFPY